MNKIIKKIKLRNLKKIHKLGNNVAIDTSTVIIGGKFISIGDNFIAGRNLYLQAWDTYQGKPTGYVPKLVIGDNVSINYSVHIAAIDKIIIGDGTLLSSKIFITDHFHGDTSRKSLETPPSKRLLFSKGPVIIGKNVWIGENVAIMPGVTIGNNSVIGANSVVTNNIPSFSVAVGSPAKVIKEYKEE